MSRHHITLPIVYMPAPPKPKKAEKRSKTGYIRKSDAPGAKGVGDAEEADGIETFDAATPAIDHPSQAPSTAIDGSGYGPSSTPGPLSAATMKIMLVAQERENEKTDATASLTNQGPAQT